MSPPSSNVRVIVALPSMASERMSFRWPICTRLCLRGLTTASSISRADMSGAVTWTVTYGMSTLGMSDTGSRLMPMTPSTTNTSSTIDTETRLSRSLSSIAIIPL